MAAPPPHTPPAAAPQPLLLHHHHPPALVLRVRGLRLARAPAATATSTAAAAAAVAPDDISQLNYRLRAIARRREASSSAASSSSSSPVDPAQAEAYLRMIRDQQRLGLRQLRREEAESDDGDEERARKGVAAGSSLGHRVDPRELEPGEYVVHKKVGVGKFACISSEDGVDYVFIQYADGMAKLAVDQAARMLYRYNLYDLLLGPQSSPTHHLCIHGFCALQPFQLKK